jgi:hypothetical protein
MVARPLLSFFPATVIFKICALRRVRYFSRHTGSKTEKTHFLSPKKNYFLFKTIHINSNGSFHFQHLKSEIHKFSKNLGTIGKF